MDYVRKPLLNTVLADNATITCAKSSTSNIMKTTEHIRTNHILNESCHYLEKLGCQLDNK